MELSRMNESLERKLEWYEEIAERVDPRPVIFSSRAEIWSRYSCPLIINDPFPSPNIEDCPGTLIQDMMEHYRNLPVANQAGHLPNLILFEFQVHDGPTEVHALFSRDQSNAPEGTELENYFKIPDPTNVVILQYPNGSDPETVSVILGADDLRPASTSKAVVRSVSVTSMLESRLGQELCENLNTKLELFQNAASPNVRAAFIFTSVFYLWDTNVPLEVIEDPSPLIRIPVDYDHEHFDIEGDILEYVANVTRENNYGPLYAYSLRYGEDPLTNVHLLFSRHKVQATSPCSSPSMINRSLLPWKIDDPDLMEQLALRLGDDFTRYLETYLPMFDPRLGDVPKSDPRLDDDKDHLIFIYRTNEQKRFKKNDALFSVEWLPPFPEHYDFKRHNVVRDVLNYMRLKYLRTNLDNPSSFYATVHVYKTLIATEVHITASYEKEEHINHYARGTEGSLLKYLRNTHYATCD